MSEIIGRTPAGRPIVRNPDGSVSTERTVTVRDPRLNDGRFTNIPTMFAGRPVEVPQAIETIVKNGGIDPETGERLPGFATESEAVNAAKRRSAELMDLMIRLGVE